MGRVVMDPITRIEGHLKIEAVVEGGEVKEARSSGTLFRGLELILRGRDPRDAQRITQRICGVCPTSHSTAAALNLDSAFGVADRIPKNGRILRNLILGSAHIADHILHFYHLSALDYVDIAALKEYEGKAPVLNSVKEFISKGLGPFLPRDGADLRLPQELNEELAAHYLKAFEMRRKAQEMLAIFGGKLPHNVGIVPGGVTAVPTVDKLSSFFWRLNELRDFIDGVYLPDIIRLAKAYPDHLEIGVGCKRTLSYGGYELETAETDLTKRERLFKQGLVSENLELEPLEISNIREEVRSSWYAEECGGRHPSEGRTIPSPRKEGAYSWIKAPRYDGLVCEVGPLARVLATYIGGEPRMRELVDGTLKEIGVPVRALFSVLGRHLARALSAKFIADSMPAWLLELKTDEPAYIGYEMPEESGGIGITEAARGALGHWIRIKDKRIELYQCVVPTTWNASPRDGHGEPGPIEQALTGIKVEDERVPVEIGRVVRSFDPCLACAVHLLSPKGTELRRVQIC